MLCTKEGRIYRKEYVFPYDDNRYIGFSHDEEYLFRKDTFPILQEMIRRIDGTEIIPLAGAQYKSFED